ncbi:uncharacterized protein E0L32_009402 [Thyridium curvatum]|uniref:AAA+ ATPase domain-containing protein n=1 Tax=Thyridium curvatum TaxID=1093900 RepID=A0A507AX03_9PEZI|nr:uncharacterized protein E0L32_009402 [Thyridium curvatum]TPX09358.1 hypothetical protein E0L32_009402 [Thyridium curvatum]
MTETVEVTKVAEVAPAAADSDDPPSYEVSTSEAGHLEDKAQPEKPKDKTEEQSQEPPGKAAEASTEKSSEKKPEASVEQSAPKITIETASEAKTEEKQPAETSSAEKAQKDAAKEDYSKLSHSALTSDMAFNWMKDLHSRMATIEVQQKEKEETSADTSESKERHMVQTKPEVRHCSWDQFKNRYSEDESNYAIETLLASDELDVEMEEEQLKRLPVDKRKPFDQAPRKRINRRGQIDNKDEGRIIERVRINSAVILALLAKVTGEVSWSSKPHTFLKPFKISIFFHSKVEEEVQAIKKRLGIPDEEGNSKPTDVLAKEAVPDAPETASSEGKKADVPSGNAEDQVATPVKTAHESSKSEAPKSPVKSSETASKANDKSEKTSGESEEFKVDLDTITAEQFKEIQCYMDFMRTEILPNFHKFDSGTLDGRTKIRFEDLWYLFRPGQLIFQRDDAFLSQAYSQSEGSETHSYKALEGPGGPRLWRIFHIWQDNPDWKVDDLEKTGAELRRDSASSPSDTNIMAYYIDFDGDSYAAVTRKFNIPFFQGERAVTRLICYPARFEKSFDGLFESYRNRGRRFREIINKTQDAMAYMTYNGWTQVRDPAGDMIEDEEGNEMRTPQFISSDVIIDFKEAFQLHAAWKPGFGAYLKSTFTPTTKYDPFSVIQWSNKSRSSTVNKVREVVIEDDDISSLEWNHLADKDNFVIDLDVREVERTASKQTFTDEDLALLPSRLCAYSLRDREFFNADIRFLKPRKQVVDDPFSNLKIPENVKGMLKSVVREHFKKKDLQKKLEALNMEILEQDFIQGKGRGLAILLHGPPGVGKTATAEAVASSHSRPLFPITCGDLGIDLDRVESTLSEVFRLANKWGCVLLLDEADILLSQREKKDDNIQRNALVSIFLRTMEYYQGILFLTTNRVGVIDEAVSSRVHFSVDFPDLDLGQTLALFDMNIDRSEKIAEQRAMITGEPKLVIRGDELRQFAIEPFQRSREQITWWNGRQIRNAFQIATSLAYETKGDSEGSAPYLGRRHFEQIEKAIEDLKTYRETIFRKTDSELAAQREERAGRPLMSDMPSPHHGRQQHWQDSRSYPSRGPAYAHSPGPSSRLTPERSQEYDFPPRGGYGGRPASPPQREASFNPQHQPSLSSERGQALPSREYDRGGHGHHDQRY